MTVSLEQNQCSFCVSWVELSLHCYLKNKYGVVLWGLPFNRSTHLSNLLRFGSATFWYAFRIILYNTVLYKYLSTVHPCLCRGTLAHCHQECLRQYWTHTKSTSHVVGLDRVTVDCRNDTVQYVDIGIVVNGTYRSSFIGGQNRCIGILENYKNLHILVIIRKSRQFVRR